MRRPRTVAAVALACLVVLASAMTAAAAAPGVGKDQITVGMVTMLTGPVSYFGIQLRDGAQLYLDAVNQRGGVHGRKIRLVVEDDECSPAKAVAAVKKLVTRDQIFALFGGSCSGATINLIPLVNQEKLPFVNAMSSHKSLMEPVQPYIFNIGHMRSDWQGLMMGDYAVTALKGKRVAILKLEGELGESKGGGAVAALKKHGLAPAAVETFGRNDTDLSSQLLRLKAQNVDVVIHVGYVNDAAIALRQAKELGLGAKWVFSDGSSPLAFLKLAGDTAVGASVIWPAGPSLPEQQSTQQMKEFIQAFRAKYPSLGEDRPDYVDLMGYAAAQVIMEGLKRAGQDPSRETFVKGLESIKDFDTGLQMPVSFSPTDHLGIKAGTFYHVTAPGKRALADWRWTAPK
jgi:branched-chain amino acid transport system substrate-binding protein